jgi:hypothetical protein
MPLGTGPIDIRSRVERSGFFLDFIKGDDVDDFSVTNITSGTATSPQVATNGRLVLNATTANQGLGSVQMANGANGGAGAYLLASSAALQAELEGRYGQRLISFGVGMYINDWSNADWFVGLGEIDTTFMLADGTLAANGGDNHVGFHHLLADGEDLRMTSAGNALANTEVTLLSAGNAQPQTRVAADNDGQFVELGFKIRGLNQLEFYVDGVLRHRRQMSNNLDTVMTPTFTMIANGGLILLHIDYLWAFQSRSTDQLS